MRFAMVTTFYPPYSFGGDGAFVRALARALTAEGHEVEVVHCIDAYELLNGGPPRVEEPIDLGIRVHRIRSRLGALSPIITQQTGTPGLKARHLRQILTRGFDVIHFHNISLIGGPGVLHFGQARCKLYTLHEHWLLCPTHIFWKERSRACDRPTCLSCCIKSGTPPQLWRYTKFRDTELQHIDRLISPSFFTADRHKRAGINRPIDVIPMFSALEDAAAVPTTDSINGDEYFLYVGRITASKGVHTLVRTVAAAPDIRLIVVGHGDLSEPLRRECAGIPNIVFIGPTPQSRLHALYAGARALVLPSLAPETFGLTVIEAAAHGVPSIVRATAGGAPEFVSASNGGIVYASEGELLAILRQFSNDPKLAAEYGARARATYARSYTREQHVARYLRCIEDVMAEKHR